MEFANGFKGGGGGGEKNSSTKNTQKGLARPRREVVQQQETSSRSANFLHKLDSYIARLCMTVAKLLNLRGNLQEVK